jgi:signal transduction histidine kinase/DNA-binding response OmpR family regulator
VILAAAVITERSIARLVNDVEWVQHTQQVIDGIDKLEGQTIRREAAGRVYQITGDPYFLERYRRLAIDVHESVEGLVKLTRDNAAQQQRLDQLQSLLDQREVLPHLKGQAAVQESRNLPVVQDAPLTAAFDALTGQLRGEEEELLSKRRTEEAASIRLTYIVLGLLAVLLAALLTATYTVAWRALVTRRHALARSGFLNLELERTNATLEVKRAEAYHANQLKSQFLANMSHELRTPLNAISGFSELMAEELAGPLNEKQKRFVGHIRQAAKHLLQLINDVLDLSKIEAGELRLEVAPLDPAPVLGEVASAMAALAREKAIELRTECEADLLVRADARRLKQILYNLLSNALKFTPESGRVDVKVWRNGDQIRFEVSDTGPGISLDDQRIIFDEFRQAAAAANGVKEGTGLGLAISKRLVERQGGQIEVESNVGQGSLFRFWLPMAEASAASATEDSATPPAVLSASAPSRAAGEESRKAPLVLVVDNDADARELIKSVLEGAGYAVATSDSSAGAVQAMKARKPDLITLDLLMPDGHGFGTLYELRSAYKEKLPPVIIVSVVEDRATGFALGATDYLLKPVSRDELLSTIGKYLPPAKAAVLVVDDDPAVLDMAREVFAEPWVTVYLAATGKQGLEVVTSQHIDAIVLDLIMPEMNGFEFLSALRRNESLRHIPVSVLTSRDLSKNEFQILQNQATKVFHKHEEWRPKLVAEIERALGRNISEGISAP